MHELLTAAKGLWQMIYGIFIRGLINFDSPVMSIIDYMLWSGTIINLIRKLFRKH